MDGLTRRTFLAASGVLGAAAALAGCSAVTESQVADAAAATPLAGGTPILVLVTLYGGNDALNTLVPYADAAYHDARPELAWKDSEVLRLDDQFGLNPALTGLHRAWQDKKLAIVRGVGYPKPDHSYFRSMDIWQTGVPDAPALSGWIGRWLDVTGGDPLQALHIGSVLPVLAVGENRMAGALTAAEQQASPKVRTRCMGSRRRTARMPRRRRRWWRRTPRPSASGPSWGARRGRRRGPRGSRRHLVGRRFVEPVAECEPERERRWRRWRAAPGRRGGHRG